MQKHSLICIASHSLTGNKYDCCIHNESVYVLNKRPNGTFQQQNQYNSFIKSFNFIPNPKKGHKKSLPLIIYN